VPFQGKISADIRDLVEHRTPFASPPAPARAPNVVCFLLDDVRCSAMSGEGGPSLRPNIDKIAGDGFRYTSWDTTDLCSPARSCLLTGHNHTRHGMACLTEASGGFMNACGTAACSSRLLMSPGLGAAVSDEQEKRLFTRVAGAYVRFYGGKKVGHHRIKTPHGGHMIAGEGLGIGRDVGDPATKDYPSEQPSRFTGSTIRRARVDVSDEPYIEMEREPKPC
jgi:hypothetical protein